MEIIYRLSREPEDIGLNVVFRHIESDDVYDDQVWNPQMMSWEHDDDACSAYIGFTSSVIIPEENARKILPKEAF